MKIGIVGLPNVGKSTLFQALTKKQVDIANYPFATIEPNVGVVAVPDDRLRELAKISKSEKVVPAAVEFVDIAGLVKGANKGEGLGNQFLHNIREVDAILQVVRDFEHSDIIHVEGSIDPKRDMEIIMTELILKDLETLQNHIPKAERELKSTAKESLKKTQSAIESLKNLMNQLDEGVPAFECKEDELTEAKKINLLTAKPFMYLFNSSGSANSDRKIENNKNYIAADLKEELEISALSGEEKNELGVSSGIDSIINKGYELLNLISFFTTGEKETRAWTIKRGSTAKQAGGAIHSDFEDKFIRASIIFWEDFVRAGGYADAREKGLLRLEGKEYIVKDGDVIEFKI